MSDELIDHSNEALLAAARSLDAIREILVERLSTLPADSADAKVIREVGLPENDVLREAIRVDLHARRLDGRL